MASTRDFKAPVIFAENADTVIPPTPIQGQSYRDIANTTEQLIKDGMKYNTIADSATLFNQFQYLLTRFSQEVEQTGLLGWSDLVDYKLHARCIGSNGIEYRAKEANGPNAGGVADPISSSTKWQEVRPQLPIGSVLALATSETPSSLGFIGVWVEKESDITINSVTSASGSAGVVSGDNTKAVPLLAHTHRLSSASIKGSFTVNNASLTGYSGAFTGSNVTTKDGSSGDTRSQANKVNLNGVLTGNTISTGEASPTLNVQSRGLNCVIWERTA